MDKNNSEAKKAGVITRRDFNKSILAATAVFGGTYSHLAFAAKTPLKVGVVNSYTGIYAQLAQDHYNGMALYFKERDFKTAGRKIEIIQEDDTLKPEVGIDKIRKLLTSDKCALIAGVQASNIAMAAVQTLRRLNAIFLCSGAGTSELAYTGYPYLFRCSINSYLANAAIAKWIRNEGHDRLLVTTADFEGGRSTAAEFNYAFKSEGGQVVQEIFAPLGNSDYGPYFSRMLGADAQAVYAHYAGADAVKFVKQYAQYRVQEKLPLYASGFTTDSDTLPAQGLAAVGIENSTHYDVSLDNQANREFREKYEKEYGVPPSVYAEYGHVAAAVIDKTSEGLDGSWEDRDKVRDTMRALKLDMPRGPFKFHPVTQGPIVNMYIRKVEEQSGKGVNVVIETYKEMAEPAQRPFKR